MALKAQPTNQSQLGEHREIISNALNKLEESTRRAANTQRNSRFQAIYQEELAAIAAARRDLL